MRIRLPLVLALEKFPGYDVFTVKADGESEKESRISNSKMELRSK